MSTAPDLEPARAFLRDELWAAALVTAPEAQPVLIDDVGPIRLAALFDPDPAALICAVTVRTETPDRGDRRAELLERAADDLALRGWQVRTELDYGHHRLSASRDGYQIAGHAFDGHAEITFTGQTPSLQAPAPPKLVTARR